MGQDIYRNALKAARQELEGLRYEETDLRTRLKENETRQVGLKQTVQSLSLLVGEDTDIGTGLSDAIREILQASFAERPTWGYTPMGIRDRLLERGFKLDQKNPMAVIHTTLKRLEDQGEITHFDKGGNTCYRWVEQEITDDDIPF